MKKIILLLSVILMSNCLSMEYGDKRPKSHGSSESSVSNNNNKVMVEYSEQSTDESEHAVRRSARKRKQSCYYKDEGFDEQSDEESSDKVVRVKKRVDSSTLWYVVCPDGKEFFESNRKQNLLRRYLRTLARHLGYESEGQLVKIELLRKAQDVESVRIYAKKEKIELKKWFMQCPGCSQILHNSKKKQALLHAVFIHWFLTQGHQPKLYQYAAKMFAHTEAGARSNYAKHKDTVLTVIPLPGDDQEKSEDSESSADGELSEESMHADVFMDIDQDQDSEQIVPVNDFFLVEPLPDHLNVFSTFIGHSHREVIQRYVLSKQSAQEVEQFRPHIKKLEDNDSIVKQWMVQRGVDYKRLVCPNQGCFQLVESDDEEATKHVLLQSLLVHQLIEHGQDSALYCDLRERVGNSFLDAQAKSRNLPAVGHQANNQFGEN